MTFRQTAFVSAAALLVATCTSCRVEDLDLNGDGVITKTEILTAAFDTVCGDSTGTDDGTTDDGTTDDGTTGDGTTDDGTASDGATVN
jgi:hypothetical protein